MGIWVYGYMGIWVYGYMGIWVYGYMGVWIYGYMGIWNGCKDVQTCIRPDHTTIHLYDIHPRHVRVEVSMYGRMDVWVRGRAGA